MSIDCRIRIGPRRLVVCFALFLFLSSLGCGLAQALPLTSYVKIVNSAQEIVNNAVQSGSNYSLMRYKDTGLLIIDYQTRQEQNKALGRITLFSEDANDSGKIVTPGAVVSNEKYLMAQDVKSEDLARFFNKIGKDGATLTPEENELMQVLIGQNVIKYENGTFYTVPETAVISVNHDERYVPYRETMVSHELQHGLDFTSPEHWQQTKASWNSLTEEQRIVFKKFLTKVGIYDISNGDLVMTEFGAFSHTTGKLSFADYVDGLVKNGSLNESESAVLKGMTAKTTNGIPLYLVIEGVLLIMLIALILVYIIFRRSKSARKKIQ